jgi:hypothetical protein
MIIGFMGNKGVGKDSAADMLAPLGFVKISFADPIKRFCAEVFQWGPEDLWGSIEAKETPDPYWNGLTPRKALQLLGTEWGRACHPEVWTRPALAVAAQVLRGGVVYSPQQGLAPAPGCPAARGAVFADCRFRSEFDAVKKAGGKMIRIYRPGFPGDGHASEMEQRSIRDDEFDAVISNDGTLWDLADRTLALLEK